MNEESEKTPYSAMNFVGAAFLAGVMVAAFLLPIVLAVRMALP